MVLGEAGAGQLGIADLQFSTVPRQVPDLPAVTSIVAGDHHVCAITTVEGDVYCWGGNESLQLGRVSEKPGAPNAPQPDPTRVATLPLPAIAVGAGTQHTCALLTDRTVWCWGSNRTGALGRGIIEDTNELPAVVPGLTDVAELAIADDSSCVRRSSGTVTCWGEGGSGQLGNGTDQNRGAPGDIPDLVATRLTLGGDHTCALLATGQYTCWGINRSGQHGNGTDVGSQRPDPPSLLGGFVEITASFEHTCALREDGVVACWGGNVDGTLGDNTTISHSTPVAIDAGGRVVAVAAGNRSTCALRDDSTVVCWGWGSRGGLGDGRSAQSTAQRVGLVASKIAAGRTHVCAVIENGDVACWGNNRAGQLGDASNALRSSPVRVDRRWDSNAIDLAIGDLHTCIRTLTGEVYCWGNNDYGQLGVGTNTSSLTPVQVAIDPVQSLDAGDAHNCASLTSNSKILCWGYNREGSLGNGTTMDATLPVQVVEENGGDAVATELALGEVHSCARRGTDVRCWGANSKGQLGSGTADRTTAIVVPGVVGAVGLIAGGASTCASEPNSLPICWGANDFSVLLPSQDSPLPPTRSVHDTGFQMARFSSCDAIAGCWGANSLGQLGDGSFIGQTGPTGPVVGLPASVTAITVGYDHACAIASGEVYCWGDNAEGQLGIGTTTRSLAPTAVDDVWP